ncbi:MAG: SLC13 family permease, partial [Candidatus Omnitrophota bacterium]
MNLTIIFAILVIIGIVAGLALEALPTSVILAGALLLFLFTGIISPSEALVGLSNRGMITVALLFIVAAAIQQTGALQSVADHLFGKRSKKGIAVSLFRMMIPVSFFSAFLNNTPIVVIFAPIVKNWAEKMEYYASKFLIPLS